MAWLGTRFPRVTFQFLRLRSRHAALTALNGGMLIVLLAANADRTDAATVHSENFEVSAESDEIARQLADCAEDLRKSLALEWLQAELPVWDIRCIVRVELGQGRLSGDTTYTLASGRARHWQMILRGPVDRVIETLLPHEVLHTVLASHFCCAVPRWADEGAALSVEPEMEQTRLWALESTHLLRGSRPSLAELFECEQYPTGHFSVRAFYAQSASVTQFLLLGGKSEFMAFVALGIQSGWEHAVRRHYGFESLASLEVAWLEWLRNDRPVVTLANGQLLAEAMGRERSPTSPAVNLPSGLARSTNRGAQ